MVSYSLSFGFVGMDYADPKRKGNVVGKIIVAAGLIAFCLIMIKQSPTFSTPSQVSINIHLCHLECFRLLAFVLSMLRWMMFSAWMC